MSNSIQNGKSDSIELKSDRDNINDDEVFKSSSNSSNYLRSTPQSDDNDECLDKGWAWVIVFASFIVQFIGDGVLNSFGLFFVEISEEYKSDGKSGVSWIISIMEAVMYGIGPIGSILVNKFSCRTVSIFGSILATIGYGTSYFTTNVPTLYFTLGTLGGMGFGLMYFSAMVIIPRYFNKYRGFAIGISACGSGLGTLVFEQIFGIILEKFTWRLTLVIGSAIIFSSVFFAFFYCPKRPNQKSPNIILNQNVTTESVMIKRKNEKKSLGYLSCIRSDSAFRQILNRNLTSLKNPAFFIFCLSDMLTSIGFQVPYVYLPEIEKHYYHTDRSLLLGIIGIANVISRFLVGYLSDKPFVNRLHIFITSLLLAGIGTIVSPHVTTIWWLRGYAGLYGVCMGTYVSLELPILIELIGLNCLTDGFGITLLFQSIGFLIGPPIVGKLYDIYGIYNPGFYFAGTMIIASGTIMLSIPIIKRKMLSKNESKVVELGMS